MTVCKFYRRRGSNAKSFLLKIANGTVKSLKGRINFRCGTLRNFALFALKLQR